MSWQAVADVLENSPSYGVDRLVEIAIAERADEQGENSYGSMADIARRANLTRFREASKSAADYHTKYDCATRAARRSVRRLEALGRVIANGTTTRGVAIHRIVMGHPGHCVPPDTMSGVEESTPDTMSGTPDTVSPPPRTPCPVTPDTVSPKPSLNHQTKSQNRTEQSSLSKKQQIEKAAEEVERRELRDELAKLEAQLRRKPDHGPTVRALERVRTELLTLDIDVGAERDDLQAIEREVGMWESRLRLADDPAAICGELAVAA
ncbi:MAG: hypothetical protein WD810_06580 [Solirubrobacterales bacterium]